MLILMHKRHITYHPRLEPQIGDGGMQSFASAVAWCSLVNLEITAYDDVQSAVVSWEHFSNTTCPAPVLHGSGSGWGHKTVTVGRDDGMMDGYMDLFGTLNAHCAVAHTTARIYYNVFYGKVNRGL
jgi:hypothetical protein